MLWVTFTFSLRTFLFLYKSWWMLLYFVILTFQLFLSDLTMEFDLSYSLGFFFSVRHTCGIFDDMFNFLSFLFYSKGRRSQILGRYGSKVEKAPKNYADGQSRSHWVKILFDRAFIFSCKIAPVHVLKKPTLSQFRITKMQTNFAVTFVMEPYFNYASNVFAYFWPSK